MAKLFQCEANFEIKSGGLGEFLFKAADQHAEKICQIDALSDEQETFGKAKKRSVRLALAMKEKRVENDDVILLCSFNTIDSAIPIIASLYLGAKVASLDPTLSIENTRHLLNLTQPKMIFVEESSLDLIEQSISILKYDTNIVVLGSVECYPSFNDLIKPKIDEDLFRPIHIENMDETAYIFFSSGTSGLPKGISLSHYAILYQNYGLTQIGLKTDKMLHLTTFYWISAVMLFIVSFITGGCRVFSKNDDAETIFQIIQKYKVSFAFLSTSLTYKLTSPEINIKYNTSSLHSIIVGGSPCSSRQIEKLKQVFDKSNVTVAYGMSEVGFITCFDLNKDKDLIEKKSNSCGKAFPGIIMKIIDLETDAIVKPLKKGEIRIKSKGLLNGYYNEVSIDHIFDEDGFLKTGDIGYYDKDECFYIVDRIKEMFKYKSWHIVPSSIEAILLEHPAVKEVVVFGTPHEEYGDIPTAAIVLKYPVDCKEIEEFILNKVLDREKLRGGIYFLNSIPKTPSGKLLRHKVREHLLCKK